MSELHAVSVERVRQIYDAYVSECEATERENPTSLAQLRLLTAEIDRLDRELNAKLRESFGLSTTTSFQIAPLAKRIVQIPDCDLRDILLGCIRPGYSSPTRERLVQEYIRVLAAEYQATKSANESQVPMALTQLQGLLDKAEEAHAEFIGKLREVFDFKGTTKARPGDVISRINVFRDESFSKEILNLIQQGLSSSREKLIANNLSSVFPSYERQLRAIEESACATPKEVQARRAELTTIAEQMRAEIGRIPNRDARMQLGKFVMERWNSIEKKLIARVEELTTTPRRSTRNRSVKH